jgi:hypothetical protein
MISMLIYFVISLIVFFLGVFQVVGKDLRSTLNWNFFAICMVVVITTINN